MLTSPRSPQDAIASMSRPTRRIGSSSRMTQTIRRGLISNLEEREPALRYSHTAPEPRPTLIQRESATHIVSGGEKVPYCLVCFRRLGKLDLKGRQTRWMTRRTRLFCFADSRAPI